MFFLYQTLIRCYHALIVMASLFSPKAKKWLRGREGLFRQLDERIGGRPVESKLAWFHCASLGEFEQGRPVMEAFRHQFPGWKILVTFFSPSGYEIRKNYDGADCISYLPLDTRRNARKFIELTRPDMAVFVKYEFWFNYIDNLCARDIPVLIISAIFRPGQHFFRWYGRWPARQLSKVTHFFVQDEKSAGLLAGIGISQVTVSGDTRFDRVAQVAESPRRFENVEVFTGGDPIMVAGSTWPVDDDLLLALVRESEINLKYIIAPHEISDSRIVELKNKLRDTPFCLFSTADEASLRGSRVLVIDAIGFLSSLYQYADLAYIGGGFGAGIHNILEAAVFGRPVFFGPNFSKFREANELIRLGGAFPVQDAGELQSKVKHLLDDHTSLHEASVACRRYTEEKKGATASIMSYLRRIL